MSTFEIVKGVEGDCLVLDNTRICGPKPWGGGRIIKTFHTDGIYEVIHKDEYRKLVAENAKLREVLESVLKCAGEIKRDSGCDTCSMYNQDGSFADGSWCRLRPELRNIGFEVEPMQRRRG